MPELQTVDLPAVEILSTGGPVRGIGSPAGGDFYSRADLETIAEASRELAAEIKAPMKIGHSDAQTLLQNSGLPAPSPGEHPAVGWLDGATARVIDGENGVEAVLVMDAKSVPRAFSELITAGAYRTRSSELRRATSQVTGKTYEWVISGLAWLGAKLPAVQTLADVVALYESAEIEHTDDVRAYVVYAAPAVGAVVWAPDSSFQSLRDDVSEALNGVPTGGMNEPRFWVCDIDLAGSRALVETYYDDTNDGYVVPFSRTADGSVTVAPSSDWTPVEQGWVAAAKEYATKDADVFQRRAESRSMEITLTDEQAAKVRETLAIEGDAPLTPELITAAAETRANELAAAKTAADEAAAKLNEAGDTEQRVVKLEADLAAEKTKRFESERDADIKEALRTRIDPADVEKWEKRYESLGAEAARELLFELPAVRDDLRTYGSDEHGGDEDEALAKSYEAEIAQSTGTAVEALI